jgi:thiamine pyrophosphokinase
LKGLIISNGEYRDHKIITEYINSQIYDCIIACDGGANFSQKNKIRIDMIIGDLDSIDQSVLKNYIKQDVIIIRFSKDKDQSDTELAIDHLVSEKISEIDIVGATGGRLDHTMANIFLLEKALRCNVKCKIIDELHEIILIDSDYTLLGMEGITVSILPFSDFVSGVTLDGFKYNINNKSMRKDHPYGISNIVNKKKATIKMDSGKLLVFLLRGDFV